MIFGIFKEKQLLSIRKPEWLRKNISLLKHNDLSRLIGDLKLNTICKEALCPNISECYNNKQATFLIMGKTCTRLCSFCNVDKGTPDKLDKTEPDRVAEAVKRMNLRFVVITSPTRDDLYDGGATHFIDTINAIKSVNREVKIEILIPDFKGDKNSLQLIKECNINIISHNLETVERLYNIRKGADYQKSLFVLDFLSKNNKNILTKSGIMLGLGETENEIYKLFNDLLSVGCKLLSIGQYLRPSIKHHPVIEYIKPEIFKKLNDMALNMGFTAVESDPYVRSSYHAENYIKKN